MKKQINVLMLLVTVLIASCTKPEVETVEENLEEPQVEIIENDKKWQIPGDEWQNPSEYGVLGPFALDALEVGTFTYLLSPGEQNIIPSKQRRFRIRFYRYNEFNGWESIGGVYELGSNVVNLKFPNTEGQSTTSWKILMSVYNPNSPTTYSDDKVVTINND